MPILGTVASFGSGPDAPTIGTATTGNASATITYTEPTWAGKTSGSVTYTATSSPGGFTGTGSSPITVSGLTNGTAYTFTVTATTSYGVTGPASAASNSITPVAPKPVVSGGTLTNDGTYYYRTFTSSGSLTVSNANIQVTAAIIAGGGAGGSGRRFSTGSQYQYGGGGGAGGFLNQTVTLGTSNYSITIGGGGAGNSGYNTLPGVGNDSTVAMIGIASGGGPGGVFDPAKNKNGGSGGGPAIYDVGGGVVQSGSPGTGVSGQGNSGNVGVNSALGRAGGGGGKGASGSSGIGGSGSSFGGVTYAAGGSGGANSSGDGPAGSSNTGNGGGGASQAPTNNTERPGGNGGSGVVIIRYLMTAV